MTEDETQPLQEESTPPVVEEVSAARAPKPSGAHYKILLLDDDRFLLDMYTTKFAQEGHEVQSCLSVAEAIDSLRKGFAANAVVFDLVMPEQDGFDLLQTIRDENLVPGAALVVLTNQGEDEERRKTEELGAHRYIVKASTIPSEVVSLIIQAIQERE